MAVILTTSEAQDLFDRVTDSGPDGRYMTFWALCREYGAWAVSDSDYTRLQCTPRGSGDGGRTPALTDSQALFIDKALVEVSKAAGENAFKSFKFCFMVTAQDKHAISLFNQQLRRRCRGGMCRPHDLYMSEVQLFMAALRGHIEDSLTNMILRNRSQKISQ